LKNPSFFGSARKDPGVFLGTERTFQARKKEGPTQTGTPLGYKRTPEKKGMKHTEKENT